MPRGAVAAEDESTVSAHDEAGAGTEEQAVAPENPETARATARAAFGFFGTLPDTVKELPTAPLWLPFHLPSKRTEPARDNDGTLSELRCRSSSRASDPLARTLSRALPSREESCSFAWSSRASDVFWTVRSSPSTFSLAGPELPFAYSRRESRYFHTTSPVIATTRNRPSMCILLEGLGFTPRTASVPTQLLDRTPQKTAKAVPTTFSLKPLRRGRPVRAHDSSRVHARVGALLRLPGVTPRTDSPPATGSDRLRMRVCVWLKHLAARWPGQATLSPWRREARTDTQPHSNLRVPPGTARSVPEPRDERAAKLLRVIRSRFAGRAPLPYPNARNPSRPEISQPTRRQCLLCSSQSPLGNLERRATGVPMTSDRPRRPRSPPPYSRPSS
jgi:hypothetical protein